MSSSTGARREAAERALQAFGWGRTGSSPETRHTFRLPGETDREISVHERGTIKWRYKDVHGIWRRKSRVDGSEEIGVYEALEAMRKYDEETRAARKNPD